MTDETREQERYRLPPNTISDEELMLQVREGIGEMLGVLFDRYQQPLFSFFMRLTGDRALSEDLVQDVFYRVLRYRHTFKPGSPFRSWLYQIARNARRDSYDPRAAQTMTDSDLSESPLQPIVLPKDHVAEGQHTKLLRRALLQLPEEKREVLLLSRYQGLKYEEIGKIVGCETNTVKVRVFRALQDLKEIFEQLQRPVNKPGTLPGVRYDM
jgi:RNA polymerase sigma factor (sigma-70 family)